jgi:hypothetical protein
VPSKGQLTGMQGVFLVAAELAGLGFVASPTSRSAAGADLLVVNQVGSRTFSVQVKTNRVSPGHFLIGKSAIHAAPNYLFVLVNIKKEPPHEFYIVPSAYIVKNIIVTKRPNSTWYGVPRDTVKKFRDKWSLFGEPKPVQPASRG